LQRMEAYRGLAILATNMKSALDVAFLRRLRFIIEFQFPGAVQRRAIWEKSFPATAPRGDIDFDRLSRLQVSGGMIRNIALNAAFLAVSAGAPIGMAEVLAAARTEFARLELPVPERDFVWNGGGAGGPTCTSPASPWTPSPTSPPAATATWSARPSRPS